MERFGIRRLQELYKALRSSLTPLRGNCDDMTVGAFRKQNVLV